MHINVFDIPHPSYQCITVLRCLYQKEFNPEVWKKLEALESHCKQRKGSPKYESDRQMVAKFVRNFFKLSDEFSEEDILRICGVILVSNLTKI